MDRIKTPGLDPNGIKAYPTLECGSVLIQLLSAVTGK